MGYNIPNIIALINGGVTDQELHHLCLAYYPKVHNEFTAGQTKSQRIQLLVEFATRQRRLDRLLLQLQAINGPAYNEYEPYTMTDSAAPPATLKDPNPMSFVEAPHREAHHCAAPGPSPATLPQLAPDAKTPEVILVLHGIRDQGEWQELVRKILLQIPQTTVIPLKYEFFDVMRFWFPIFTRSGPVKQTLLNLRDAQNRNPCARISVIAHSFGTYVITKILVSDPTITLHRLILCGCVVPRKFNWARYGKQVQTRIVNDCGARDVWPVMAQSASWGYGASGTYGFGSASVSDRFHDFGHSGFLETNFVTSFWLPWFRDGNFVESDPPPSRSYLWSLLTVPFLQIKVLALLVILAALYYGNVFGIHEHLRFLG